MTARYLLFLGEKRETIAIPKGRLCCSLPFPYVKGKMTLMLRVSINMYKLAGMVGLGSTEWNRTIGEFESS
jgi:hypothetical protein